MDLVQENPEILEHFSDYCKNVLSDPNLLSDALEESKLYAQFNNLINQLEMKRDPNFIPNNPEGEIPTKLWEYRQQLYQENDYYKCKKANTNVHDTYRCLIERRQQMIASISKEINQN